MLIISVEGDQFQIQFRWLLMDFSLRGICEKEFSIPLSFYDEASYSAGIFRDS
jgi:hypothetical protein